MQVLDTFLGFYTQLEGRDKINKVFQNFFRCLAGLSDTPLMGGMRPGHLTPHERGKSNHIYSEIITDLD